MSRFRKSGKREVPSLSTASLPDLIFTLLFFFMIVTNFREPKPKLEFELPTSSESEKLERKNLITYIFMGNDEDGNQIQINNNWIDLDEIPDYIEKERDKLHEDDQDKMTVVLKIDKSAKMGLVSEIKESIRKADVYVVNYAVNEDLNLQN